MLLINTLDGISMLLTPTANVVTKISLSIVCAFCPTYPYANQTSQFSEKSAYSIYRRFLCSPISPCIKHTNKIMIQYYIPKLDFFLKHTRDEVKREINLFTFNGNNKSKHNNRLLQHARPCMKADRVLLYIFNPENIAKQ